MEYSSEHRLLPCGQVAAVCALRNTYFVHMGALMHRRETQATLLKVVLFIYRSLTPAPPASFSLLPTIPAPSAPPIPTPMQPHLQLPAKGEGNLSLR